MMQRFRLFFAALLAALLGTGSACAQDATGLVLHYDFENVSGKTVSDQSGSGANATLANQATVEQMGKFHVLNLGKGTGYLDMTAKAGSVAKALGDFTVSVYYRVDDDASLSGAGFFLWCFSQSAANTADASPYTAYRLNVQRMATSTGGYAHETGMEIGSESAKGRWVHTLYRQSAKKGELYIDGQLRKTVATMPLLSETFTAAPAYNWIGRAPFSADSYLTQTLVYDFRLYDKAVSDEEIATLSALLPELDHEYSYGTPGDFAALEKAVGECKAFVAAAGDGYPANAVAEMQDEISLAQASLNAKAESQTLVDKRVERLGSALAKLKGSKGFDMKEATSAAFAPEHGFVHPGALHTQADFDRIKQLLADGDPTITAAYNALKAGEYAQSGVATWPVETIIRGGGSGQNYMNAARGAAMAYQNALVWKIGGKKANADATVRILMAWARGNKYVSGDTNMSLASGLYGYAFANAAELVRDYEGWSPEDKEEFKQYILNTWYPVTNDFLRRRHDTWLNARNNVGQRPGHYWSNWGLCNTLAMMCYGIFLDDVHMYNQGVSFFKHDHVGTFSEAATLNRTDDINNWGLTEFLGNLVPVIHEDARGPFGYLGQMQESGRDAGHEQMAAGLAVDIAQVGWNQGDDLFGYMDNRLAAGLEFVAAHNFSGVTNLPWTNYNYADCRTAWHNVWHQTGYGSHGESRPYWDRVVGHYEGVKGVKMRYSEAAAKAVRGANGYDMGGHSYGETSGGYDHLGFSTLTCYRPAVADPASAPITIGGRIVYKGQTLNQTELGGLKYTYNADGTHAIPADGSDIHLVPVLPEGEEDTGNWQWNTGETTREITVKADHSYLYRASYTGANGAVSERMFSIAVAGDCTADKLTPEITVDGVIHRDTAMSVFYGTNVILYTGNQTGWTNDYRWDNGTKDNSVIVIPNITTSRDYVCHYTNTGGHVGEQRFRINVQNIRHRIYVNGAELADTFDIIVNKGDQVSISPLIASSFTNPRLEWSDGSTGAAFELPSIGQSGTFTLRFTSDQVSFTQDYTLSVRNDQSYDLPSGDYLVLDRASGKVLTVADDGKSLVFAETADPAAQSQLWRVEQSGADGNYKYKFTSLADGSMISASGRLASSGSSFLLTNAVGTDHVAISTATKYYWGRDDDDALNIRTGKELTVFPFRFVSKEDIVGIRQPRRGQPATAVEFYTLGGVKTATPPRGICIRKTTHADGSVTTDKIRVQ